MSPLELDPRLRFDSYVVGAANRLATAAARRVAESPGRAYNPLFFYGASGLGKTHLLTAMGHHARELHPELPVFYATLEHLMEEIVASIEAGERDAFLSRLGGAGVVLLDDVQFLAGRHRTQEELLRAWDSLSAQGGQIVLASDRPPQEIDGLDQRLLSRFSGGLIADIGAPDYETRVAIVRRKAEERGHAVSAEVADALARVVLGNVRELQGALNRVIATEELQGRAVPAAEVAAVLGLARGPVAVVDLESEFDEFLADLAGTVDTVFAVSPPEQRLREAMERWRAEGYAVRALEIAAGTVGSEEEAEALVRRFAADIERLRAIAREIESLDPQAPELEEADVLLDPDRLIDAESLLGVVRDRAYPLPAPPPGPGFEALTLPPDLLALRAAVAVAEAPGERYNPLFVHGPDRTGKSVLLATLGRRLAEARPGRVAFVSGGDFAAELIAALEKGRAETWRARYRRAEALLVDDVDVLAGTDRAQEELFHLFDLLLRQGAQLVFTADSAPAGIEGLEDRLRTRLGSGLVVELPPAGAGPAAGAQAAEPAQAAEGGAVDGWFRSREKVVWEWPYLADSLIEELE